MAADIGPVQVFFGEYQCPLKKENKFFEMDNEEGIELFKIWAENHPNLCDLSQCDKCGRNILWHAMSATNVALVKYIVTHLATKEDLNRALSVPGNEFYAGAPICRADVDAYKVAECEKILIQGGVDVNVIQVDLKINSLQDLLSSIYYRPPNSDHYKAMMLRIKRFIMAGAEYDASPKHKVSDYQCIAKAICEIMDWPKTRQLMIASRKDTKSMFANAPQDVINIILRKIAERFDDVQEQDKAKL